MQQYVNIYNFSYACLFEVYYLNNIFMLKIFLKYCITMISFASSTHSQIPSLICENIAMAMGYWQQKMEDHATCNNYIHDSGSIFNKRSTSNKYSQLYASVPDYSLSTPMGEGEKLLLLLKLLSFWYEELIRVFLVLYFNLGVDT